MAEFVLYTVVFISVLCYNLYITTLFGGFGLKKYAVIALAFLLVLSLFGCADDKNSDSIVYDESDIWGITFSSENVTPSGMTLKIIQSGGEYEGQLEYGMEFSLEIRQNRNWIPVEPEKDIAWEMIAYTLPENDITRLDINWAFIYGRLPAGHYRLGKEIMDFRGTGDYDTRTYYAEFTLY